MRPASHDLARPDEIADWESSLIDRLWAEAGRPDPFTVVQIAAGDGAVATRMLKGAHPPAFLPALRLVLVEADDVLRQAHSGRLPVEAPSLFLGPVSPAADPDEDPAPVSGMGPIVTSLGELPAVRGWCLVVAVGWLSRFAYDLFEWHDDHWYELRLAAAGDSGEDLQTIAVGLDPDRASRLDELIGAGTRVEGGRYGVREAAGSWLRGALASADAGWVVAADRWEAATAPVRGGPVPVAVDQLSAVRRPEAYTDDGPGGLGVARWRIG